MTAITHAISAALLHFIWEGLLVALLAWVALAILRDGSARRRYAVGCVALGIMTVLPVATARLLYRAPGVPLPVAGIPRSAGPSAAYQAASLPAWIAALENWALPLWLLGVLIFAIRLIWISRHVAAFERAAEAADASLIGTVARLARRMGVGRPLRVLTSRLADSPCVLGWLRPAIPAGRHAPELERRTVGSRARA